MEFNGIASVRGLLTDNRIREHENNLRESRAEGAEDPFEFSRCV